MKILVINCGSSSIKYQLFAMPERSVVVRGLVERIGEAGSAVVREQDGRVERRECPVEDHLHGMQLLLDGLESPDGDGVSIAEIAGVGHRVVHGGETFSDSVLITDSVVASIERFSELAPLHNPANLTGIAAARRRLPATPHVACFDTAFHSTLEKVAFLYALPYEVYHRYRVRRYGFHGVSHRWVARRAAELLGIERHAINCITCHLGNGCSIAAIRNGRSVDTSMGFTPLEGLIMGTRCGDFDPAILFYLAEKGYTWESLNTMCNKQSGLLGISGTSNDMRTLTRMAAEGDGRARLAIDMFSYRLKKYIGAYLAVLGRTDALVFTGGIGENAPHVRAAACHDLQSLGIAIDPEANRRAVGCESRIGQGRIATLVIPTNEECQMASDTFEIVRSR